MLQLPIFPKFEPLSIDHKDLLQAIADKFPSYSDFNFISLFSWDINQSVLVSELNGNLVIKFSDYVTKSSFYSFLGINELENTIETLIKYSSDYGTGPELVLVPDSVIKSLPPETALKLDISEDRDNHDYILSVADLVEFRTNKYRGKKNLLNRFEKEYGDQVRSEEIDLSDISKRKEVIELLTEWQKSRKKNMKEVDNEFLAIKRGLAHSDILRLEAFGIYINERLVAFTLFEILPNKIAVIHFDKADVRYTGVYEHLKHNLAKHLATLDVETINYEQDLGIEGLRRAKESYHPIEYLKKYRVRLKDSGGLDV